MATAALIREALKKARRYKKDLDAAAADNELDPPDFDAKCEALLPVLSREIPVHIHAHRADDICTGIRIAKEFGLDYSIIHCTEGHLISEILKSESTKVMCGPLLCDRSKPELYSLTPSSAGILDKAGVNVSIITDHPVIPVQYLMLCVSLAVKNGMDRFSAYKAVTINPARLCGIDSRVGSIEIGKDADLVLFNGDPLDIFTKVIAVYIDGRKVK
ncbi:Adenine deaminase [bioreactor metagenome]|uniref:Adenine deaminase n=1 Tax=bioreactor metagenome TaxID=1076179 RepID=A0A645HAL8_9ZZZZ